MMKRLKLKLYILLYTIVILAISGCLPEQEIRTAVPTTDQNQTIDTGDTDNNASTTGQLSESTNFLQLGTSKSTTTLSIFSDYSDSFLLRGNDMISLLKEKTLTTQNNYCMVVNFPGSTGVSAKNILVMSARVRSYYNSAIQTKEYFLQMEPNNESINQTDCLTLSLTNKIQAEYSTTNLAFKISDICPDCNINTSSTNIKLYETNGIEEINAKISFLFLNIIPSVGTSIENPPICTVNENCTSINFNCCLAGQCVNHGAVKNGVDTTSDKYLIAKQLVSGRPELIKNYTDVFYVCPLMVPTDTTDEDEEDPVQQANDLFVELNNLYNCTTPKVDELSICVNEFSNASQLMASSPYQFTASKDDLTFSSITSASGNNIVQIDYAGITLFKEKLLSSDTEVSLGTGISLSSQNDNLTSFQIATAQVALPANSINDIMSVHYKVDGTCEKLGVNLARCKKFYKQGQSSSPGRSSDHASGNNNFALPSYADTGFNVIVEVGGSAVPSGSDSWNLSGNSVIFNPTTFPIYDNQDLTITYFVSNNVSDLTASKELAQTKIDDHCACDPNKDPCTLTPVKSQVNGVDTVTSFICTYPTPDVPGAPLQETFYISAKTVPHKFYDTFGVNYDLGDNPSANPQEGTKFEYTDGNNLKPNNLTQDIGFNEIYGTMNVDGASPVPPKVIEVEKGKSYDIIVSEGAFSTCLNCGTDYYSGMQKVFPNNFSYKGAGYLPDNVESRRRSNAGDYRADDLRFGRACFVPASMIPWTHVTNSDITTQRRNRQDAQHYLFSNGYNKDWYGFDYGSIIGSFDGVKWFAIGNQRRIKANSKKLYVAVNAYFGDLTISNSFKITINEMNPAINSGSFVTHDTDSDGAQCQRAHYCDNDNDCITQLGYDYTCLNVSSVLTPWPQFDTNGNEMSGSLATSLLGLVGGSNGQVKRCVYRGQGAACEQRSFGVSSTTSYTGSSLASLHTCSNNSICSDLSQPNFNTKIARFAESPGSQNIQTFVTDKTDTFGLGARNLGRPYDYYGKSSTPGNITAQLNTNNVKALCVPGKDVDNITNLENANYFNSTTREADIISNVGRTMSSLIQQDENYFAACPSTNEDGDFTHLENLNLNDLKHKPFAINANLSTNSLIIPSLATQNIFNDTGSQITRMGYQKNSCLRAPGAKCFSDYECAPNSFISTKFKSVSNFNGEINSAEESFWEEELVCANSQARYQEASIYPNPLYQTYEHHCCRETDKSFTYFSQPHENSTFKVVDSSGTPLIPGVNQDINDPERYSRTHTVYDKLISEPTKYPSLVTPASQPSSPLVMTLSNIRQYNTLHLNNERMCCTGHWVREFATGSNANNGGHKFTATSQQNIPITTFKSLSWNANNIPAINTFPAGIPDSPPFTCSPYDFATADCEVKNILEDSSFEKKYLQWFGKFELIGIPQVLIETNSTVEKPLSTEDMDLDNNGTFETPEQQDISSSKLPIENTIKDQNGTGVVDATFGGKNYYSAASYDNLEIGSGKLKKVFSESEFNCCIPTGFEVANTTTDSACCTGKVATIDSKTRCCLEDFTDLSVYTNRYVSSEGAFFNGQEMSESNIDPATGYIKKEEVIKMAATMCCSGMATTGKAIGDYHIPINFDEKMADSKTRRFTYLETLDDDAQVGGGVSKYNAGLKWNDHVYCIPADFDDSAGGGDAGGGAIGN